MQSWLVIFIGRLLRGERLENATPYNYRLWVGILFLTPVLMASFTKFGKPMFDAPSLVLWLGLTGFGLVTLSAVMLWARFVPAVISLGLAIVSWSALFYLYPLK